MSGTTLSSDRLEPRRKKALFRAWHRGTREMDLLLGQFADAHLPSFSEDELTAFEGLMETPDQDLFKVLMSDEPPLGDKHEAMIVAVRAFHRGRDITL